MFNALSPDEFASLLGDIWMDRGWEVDVKEREDESGFLVSGERANGASLERGLILVKPDGEIGGQALQRFAETCEEQGIDVRVVATRGKFTEHAERMAGANDIHLLTPDALAATVREEGLEHLLERYKTRDGSDGRNGEDGSNRKTRLPGLPFSLPGLPSGTAGLVVSVLIVLAAFGAGTATSGVLLGGGAVLGESGALFSGDDGVPVSAVSTAGPNETADLVVGWRAAERSSLAVGESTYEAPADEQFMVVQLRVTNPGSEPRAVRASRFVFAANGTVYANQPLNGTRYFPPARLDSGETREFWTVFSVPADATSGTLLVDQQVGSGPVAVRFVHEPGLALNLTAAT